LFLVGCALASLSHSLTRVGNKAAFTAKFIDYGFPVTFIDNGFTAKFASALPQLALVRQTFL